MSELLIHYHPNSLEGFCNGGNTLKMIGVGRQRTPGHPAGNQQYHSQMAFLRLAYTQRLFPAYYVDGDMKIYMGEYSVYSLKKKQSFEGFTYFLFTLIRKKLPPSLIRECTSASGQPPLATPIVPDLQRDLEGLDKKAQDICQGCGAVKT